MGFGPTMALRERVLEYILAFSVHLPPAYTCPGPRPPPLFIVCPVQVQPLIDQARRAVGQIKKENIDEIRSLKMPPDAIRDVLEGVLLVLGQVGRAGGTSDR